MKRLRGRLFLPAFLLITFFLALGSSAAEKRPNIIFILADDLSYRDIGHFGQKNFSTPHIDRLAEEGRVFSNAYAGGPWCAPSRTALMTGMSTRYCVLPLKQEPGGGTKFNPTIAEMLKSAGYSTCALGKWHMFEGNNDSWFFPKTDAERIAGTNWKQMPWNRGFDVCRIGYHCGFMGSNGNPYFPWQIETGDRQEIPIPENRNLDVNCLWKDAAHRYDAQGRFLDKAGNNSSKLRYSEDIYRDEAVKFMRANRDKPFFLYYATPLVHGPLNARELGEFRDKSKPWTLQHKIWAAMVTELDRSVGILHDEVKNLGLEKNTLIIFASDNGYAGYTSGSSSKDDPLFQNKGPWNRGKFSSANGGVIIPFIAWGPGRVPVGQTNRAVNFYDVMATAGELAGAKLPGPTDGVSFVPLLEGRDNDQPTRNAMIWLGSRLRYRIGMTDDWAEVKSKQTYFPNAVLLDEKWFAIHIGKNFRLFDILADPGMKQDLASQQPELLTRARAEFQKAEIP